MKSRFSKCVFNYTYFLDGLFIDSCIYDSYLDFEAGGHNLPGSSFYIHHCTFHEFVNFFDAWFQGEVNAISNIFKKGTNILGNKGGFGAAYFEFEPTVGNNTGNIDEDGDGGKPNNIIDLT